MEFDGNGTSGLTKEQKLKKYQKEYYAKNKEKIKAYQKEYQKKWLAKPENAEWKKGYMTEYTKEYTKKWRAKNPERWKASMKKYQDSHREQIKDYQKRWRDTMNAKKIMRIGNWKQIGIVDSDFDLVYDTYINTKECMICGNKFKNSLDRHLDHDHETGEIRYICCRSCNIKILG
tara:strand:+ start:1455 stop:1979 length:525 start_codon:yes stop_codon:yes gene_type:complete